VSLVSLTNLVTLTNLVNLTNVVNLGECAAASFQVMDLVSCPQHDGSKYRCRRGIFGACGYNALIHEYGLGLDARGALCITL